MIISENAYTFALMTLLKKNELALEFCEAVLNEHFQRLNTIIKRRNKLLDKRQILDKIQLAHSRQDNSVAGSGVNYNIFWYFLA